ncbi:hypothetical protein NVP1121O_132 [Vibrio phage 1.121.O._10N.286.46.C4]|nr:hypothetical protein NVP1121O_132 [Vibrio phage 1.121.O._10N.286.46.C4]
MKATSQHLKKAIEKVNSILSYDSTWSMQTAFTAFIEHLSMFENVFLTFEDETFIYGEEYDFTLEFKNGEHMTFTIYQAYEDIPKLSFEY